MKNRSLIFSALAVVTLSVGWSLASQDKDKSQKQAQQQQQPSADMPNEIHKFLARLAGEYATETKLYEEGKVTDQSKGEAKLDVTMGDRFIVEQNHGDMLGRKFEGVRIFGYNNASKLFESTWTFSEATSMMTMTGRVGDDRKTILWDAVVADENNTTLKRSIKTTFIDGDHFAQELTTSPADGAKATKVETIYTRKKETPRANPN